MPIAHGRRICILQKRHCSNCHRMTDQICYRITSCKSEMSDQFYRRAKFWTCNQCGANYEEISECPKPTEEAMLFRQFLKLGSDYDVKNASIDVTANKMTVEFSLHSFDPAHIRRIIYKAEDTGHITVYELAELEKAGARTREDREKFLIRSLSFKRKEYIRERIFSSKPES